MNSLAKCIHQSPTWVRVLPFAIFLVLTYCQNQFGEAGKYWIYLLKTLVGGWFVWQLRPWITEMKWKISAAAILVGVGVFALWVGLDGIFRALGYAQAPRWNAPSAQPWNPFMQFGAGALLAWFFVVVRIVGSSLVVPPLEEVFFRSWLYRYLIKQDFLNVPLSTFRWIPFLLTAAVFGAEHQEWLAGILCGVAFQGLVCWKGRLGDAITAHAITNFLLGLWVVCRGAWQFW